jgi:hypothetical protein
MNQDANGMELKLGDIVEVVHRGHMYTSHNTAPEALGLTRYRRGIGLENGTIVTIVGIATEDSLHSGMIGIEADDAHQYLINMQGLKLLRRAGGGAPKYEYKATYMSNDGHSFTEDTIDGKSLASIRETANLLRRHARLFGKKVEEGAGDTEES